ncbi:hypothetical protein ABZP36_003994 [Zizania latifolia]
MPFLRLKREFVPCLNVHGPDFSNCPVAVTVAFGEQRAKTLALAFADSSYLLPYMAVVTYKERIGGVWPICHLWRTQNSDCFCLRGSACNLAEAITQEYHSTRYM